MTRLHSNVSLVSQHHFIYTVTENDVFLIKKHFEDSSINRHIFAIQDHSIFDVPNSLIFAMQIDCNSFNPKC